jgi:hypothetical protein
MPKMPRSISVLPFSSRKARMRGHAAADRAIVRQPFVLRADRDDHAAMRIAHIADLNHQRRTSRRGGSGQH